MHFQTHTFPCRGGKHHHTPGGSLVKHSEAMVFRRNNVFQQEVHLPCGTLTVIPKQEYYISDNPCMQYLISTPEPPSDQQIFQALIVWQDRLVMLSTECEGSMYILTMCLNHPIQCLRFFWVYSRPATEEHSAQKSQCRSIDTLYIPISCTIKLI